MKGKIKVLIISLLLLTTFVLTSCGGPTKTTCYWCGEEEECYMYNLQYLDGYNPNGSFKYGYETKYMSSLCALECESSGQYLNVTKVD